MTKTRKPYPKIGLTGGYTHLAEYLGRDGVDSVFEGYVSEYAYGKKGKTFRTHDLRSWKSMTFWLGAEALDN